ncbi:MAG: SDR family oxidoreductase [Candidatus Omnitrophica bacterium]|nr:SDR family oxidoreductase [Candidatus Omnitrophota bacterium]
MRIALTGATGLIGRNLLFEILKTNINNLDDVDVLVLGRHQGNLTIRDRIEKIITEDGLLYLQADKNKAQMVAGFCKDRLRCIYIDLEKRDLGIKPDDYKLLNGKPIDFFYHIAALTDLRDAPGVDKELEKTNIFGTQKILQLVATLKVKQFCYVGTAYSCGNVSGNVLPDSVNPAQEFRSPYERTKQEAETYVRNFAKETGMRCRYFRPSVTCGRLIEPPIGSINKYDVFYGWGAFFLYMKLKQIKRLEDRYAEPATFDIRVCYSLKRGLNIVPADYAAKIMYQVCVQNDPGESYHLVNNAETPHYLYTSLILKTFNIKGIRQVDQIPDNLNHLEQLYYKTAGQVFTPYTSAQSMLFNVENLRTVCKNASLYCPSVDEKTLPLLIKYAKDHDFGVLKNNASKTVLVSPR